MIRTSVDLLLGIAGALFSIAVAILVVAWVASLAGPQDEVTSTPPQRRCPIYDLALTADGKTQFAAVFGEMLAAGDVRGGAPLTTLLEKAYFFCRVEALPDDRLLFGCREGAVVIADRALEGGDLQELDRIAGLRDITATPDGKLGAAIGNFGDVRAWDLQERTELASIRLTADLNALAFASDGSLAIRHGNGWIARFDWRRGESVGRWPAGPHGPGCIACCPVSTRVACGTSDGRILIRCLDSGRLEHDLSIGARQVMALRYCPEGRFLAAGSDDGAITVIDVVEGKIVAEVTAHKGCVSQLIVLPDGQELLSSSYDGTIRRWTFPDLEELQCVEAPLLPADP